MMLPQNVSLKYWADSLIVDFPSDNIPILHDENDWKTWGNFLIQENSFLSNAAPGTQLFPEWKSWADAVFKAMADF